MARKRAAKAADSPEILTPSAQRKIYFHRIHAFDALDEPVAFDAHRACAGLRSSTFDPGGLGYQVMGDGDRLAAWVDESSTLERVKLIFGRTRTRALPQIEHQGKRRPIALQDDHGICEPIHLIFFPGGYVGAEYNHYGPRLSRLPEYLRRFDADGSRLELAALIDANVLDELHRLTHLTSIDFVTKAGPSDLNSGAINRLIEDAAKINGRYLTVGIRAESRKSPLSRDAFEMARDLAQRLGKGEFKKFKVAGLDGTSGRIERLDLMRAYILSEETVAKIDSRHRTLDSDSVFGAIEAAYEKVSPRLPGASEVY